MLFEKFCEYLERLSGIPSRNEMMVVLAGVVAELGLLETDKGVYLLLGQLRPSFEEVVFNMADKMMVKAVSTAFGVSPEKTLELYKQKGDLGEVAYESHRGGESKKLNVGEVYDRLWEIARLEGEGSQDLKIAVTAKVLSDIGPLGAKYAVRMILGKLRLGFSDKTILDALSFWVKGDKSAKDLLESVYQVLPDVGRLTKEVKEKGLAKAAAQVEPVVGVPLNPMLAQRLRKPVEMIAKMGKVAVEPKLDGLRLLIHFKRGKGGFVKAFTRNLHDVAWMFPELGGMEQVFTAQSLILDAEVVGVNEKRRELSGFQATMTRRRKYEIEAFSQSVPVKFYVFDILHKDGEGLLSMSYEKRRTVLLETVTGGGVFEVVESMVTEDPEKINSVYKKRISEGYEGILVKKVDSGYVPGRTGWRWVKMKEAVENVGKLSDTVDCMVMGYSVGQGKRAGFGLGQFLVGVSNKDRFCTITKVGTGLTDEEFKSLGKLLDKYRVEEKPAGYEVNKIQAPDYWVKPVVVVEVAGDEITKSPSHTSGYGIRFPRLVKLREDKDLSSATTIEEVKQIFEAGKK